MIDLRSDTVTLPTDEMRRAMAMAEVGDDVFGEDPTVRRLEELGARMIGKEAALFVASGTMGNQVSALTHLSRGDEVIVEADSHIYFYEVGGLGALCGAHPRPLTGVKGFMAPSQIKEAIREEDDIHLPRTALLCIENTHNRAGGAVLTPEQTRVMVEAARERNIPTHLDGARIFNAACALDVDVKELTAPVDSVMFCLSKGLGAPVGSLLAGDRDFITRARKYRKALGGGMRQAGILAAAGLVALETMVERLALDHQNARLLAEGLAEIPGIAIDLESVQTNIVIFSIKGLETGASEFLSTLATEGLLGVSFGGDLIRFVTHKDVTADQIKMALQIIKRIWG